MANSIFGIAISGLNAAQAGLLTAEHNISNAATPGFSRQQTSQVTSIPQLTGSGFLGQGVQVSTVLRVYSEFLSNQVLQAQTQSSQLDSYFAQIKQIDNMLADPHSGLSPALQDFFKGVNDVAANPSSIPSRQALLSNAQSLVARFQGLNQRLSEIRSGINSQITSSVAVINSYAQQIAALNNSITVAQGNSGGDKPPNDLLDQRDQLVALLNTEIKATAVKQNDGTYNVFIGNGQALVAGTQTMTLAATSAPDDPGKTVVGYVTGGSTVLLSENSLQGGSLGGYLAFRSETLDSAQNALGRVAIGVAQTFNDQHRLGLDLSDTLGGSFFSVATPSVLQNSNNTGNAAVTANIADVGYLTSSDYKLAYDGSKYLLTRLSDGTTTTLSGFPGSPVTVDGITIKLSSGSFQSGDSFLIQPARNGARDLGIAISDTTKIAAAAPMRTNSSLANTGSGAISAGAVNPPVGNVTITFNALATQFTVVDNTTGATLAAGVAYTGAGQVIRYPASTGWPINISNPAGNDTFTVAGSVISTTSGVATVGPTIDNNVTITFTSATTFDVVDNTTGATLAAAVAYDPSTGLDISYNGWTAKLSGAPITNDTFTISPNIGGAADNRNALLLAGLQSQNTLVKNTAGAATASYQGAFSQLVSQIGNKTRQTEVASTAQSNLVEQTKQTQQSMSGVNLDEEAANLIRYQQIYQASGKMLQIATTLFNTLLDL